MVVANTSRKVERRQAAKSGGKTPAGLSGAMKRTQPRLFVSFWNLCLENLPQGAFRHRKVTPAEAKRLIDAARTAGSLSGVSEDDLLAPYHKREKDNHAKLCRALRKDYDIALSLKDFVLDDHEDDGGVGYMINPLQFAEIEGPNRLLLVNCHFVMPERRKKGRLDFDIAADSATFHLFEALDSKAKSRGHPIVHGVL